MVAISLILTPTSSLAGGVQVVARSLEVALHKVHALGFPLEAIIDGTATAPVCPPSRDFITTMGRTNDAILFGGQAHLFVDSSDADAADLAQKLPSSPAQVSVTSLKTGKTFHAGRLDEKLLEQSFS